MAMVDTGSVRLHVQRIGPRGGQPATATVVLVHGLLTDSLASYYFTVAPAFAAAGLDVVMYDLRGHGRSGRPAEGYTVEHNIDDLEALLDRLAVTGPVHLVGNSFGGTIAFGFAARRPERVASVSLIESEPATAAWAEKLGHPGPRRDPARPQRARRDRLDQHPPRAQHGAAGQGRGQTGP
ncbi:alpha/beta fold hydrolase [Streptomyces sanglieri]|uniref:Alpha/beta fold hydrolase n=1 Tax=Streptomyces sanglieri TaxID=193460 RepID=A0ABW2X7L6_9ACTN